MIEMFVSPIAGSRTNTGLNYLAEIAGQRYEARSRHGAANALARELVAAGVADDRVTVTYQGTPGHLTYRSLHRMAGFTYSEGNAPLSRTRWVEYPARLPGTVEGEGVAMAGDDPPVPLATPEPSIAPAAAPQLSHTCSRCGEGFAAKRADARFCSTRCQVAHHRAKAGRMSYGSGIASSRKQGGVV